MQEAKNLYEYASETAKIHGMSGYALAVEEFRAYAASHLGVAKEYQLPAIFKQLAYGKGVPVPAYVVLELTLLTAGLCFIISGCWKSRLLTALALVVLNYYYAAGLLALTCIYSLFSVSRRSRQELEVIGAERITSARNHIMLTLMVGIGLALLSASMVIPPKVMVTGAALFVLVIFMQTLTTVQYHSASDVVRPMITISAILLLFWASTYVTMDAEQVYLMVKTGAPTFSLLPFERQMISRALQVNSISSYLCGIPNDMLPPVFENRGVCAPTGVFWKPTFTFQFHALVGQIFLAAIAMLTVLAEHNGSLSSVIGGLKTVIKDGKVEDLFNIRTWPGAMTAAFGRPDWLLNFVLTWIWVTAWYGWGSLWMTLAFQAVGLFLGYCVWHGTMRYLLELRGTEYAANRPEAEVHQHRITTIIPAYRNACRCLMTASTVANAILWYLEGYHILALCQIPIAFLCCVTTANTEWRRSHASQASLGISTTSPSVLLAIMIQRLTNTGTLWTVG